ncbi:MAG: hypothetical protein V4755_15005 [Curtobacterium sp.]
MTVAVVPDTDPTTPVRPDGEQFYAALISPGTSSVFADTLTEIVAELIPDYPNDAAADGPATDSDEALMRRIDFLAELAANMQAVVAADATAAGRSFTESELTAIFTARDQGAPHDADWNDDATPLLVLRTSYAPYGPHPLPTGAAVHVLDPLDELSFLQSVALLRGGALLVR